MNVLHPKLIIISSLPNESSLQAVQRQIDLPLRNVVCPQLLVKRNSVQPKPRSNFGINMGAETFFFKNFQKKLDYLFSCLPTSLGDISFYELENKTKSSKVIYKYLAANLVLGALL